jgi:steroid 5-alpha reductase family enzyme
MVMEQIMGLAVPGLAAALALTTLVWIGSLARRDASIIDIFWGLGFVFLAWFYGDTARTTATRRCARSGARGFRCCRS